MTAPKVEFSQPEPGLFHVRYAEPADLLPERQAELVAAIEGASRASRVGIVFEVSPAIRSVDMSVPGFWLQLTSRSDLGLRAMGIVTRSAAVRVAASGFGLANRLRQLPIQVETFAELDAAMAWARAALAA